jgi:hypothetical protein
MLSRNLWYLAIVSHSAPINQKSDEIDIEHMPHPGTVLPVLKKRSTKEDENTLLSGSMAKTSTYVSFDKSNNENCVEIPEISSGSLHASCAKEGHFEDGEECQLSCNSGVEKTIRCLCKHTDFGFTRVFMGCNYEFPEDDCVTTASAVLTTEESTTSAASKKVEELREEITVLEKTVEKITAKFLAHHEEQTENIEGSFVMTSLQLNILTEDALEASTKFIENQVYILPMKAVH